MSSVLDGTCSEFVKIIAQTSLKFIPESAKG